MPAQTTNLFLLEELEDVGRTSELAQSDLDALAARRRLDQDLRGQASQGSRPRWARLPLRTCVLGTQGHSGSLQSRSPNGTCQKSSSL
jgi:hypothetical protein